MSGFAPKSAVFLFTDEYWSGYPYWYDSGVWRPMSDAEIMAEIESTIEGRRMLRGLRMGVILGSAFIASVAFELSGLKALHQASGGPLIALLVAVGGLYMSLMHGDLHWLGDRTMKRLWFFPHTRAALRRIWVARRKR
jgi:hypothetical protein